MSVAYLIKPQIIIYIQFFYCTVIIMDVALLSGVVRNRKVRKDIIVDDYYIIFLKQTIQNNRFMSSTV